MVQRIGMCFKPFGVILLKLKLTKMKIYFKEYALTIDNVINEVTNNAIQKDMFNMTQQGIGLPNTKQMPEYVQHMRSEVQKVLEQSN